MNILLACVVVLSIVASLYVLFEPRLLHRTQPSTKKAVVEVMNGGPVAQWFLAKNWAAFTIPFPFVVVILYWLDPHDAAPDPYVRVHEFVHVQQDARNSFFAVTWWNYGRELWRNIRNKWDLLRPSKIYAALVDTYTRNSFEEEAYAVENDNYNRGVLPEWAQ